jgi:hypothetical protein
MRVLKKNQIVICSIIAILVAAVAISKFSSNNRTGSVAIAPTNESLGERIPVANNRGPEVVDGFRGEVHPILFGETRLELTAHWSPIGKRRKNVKQQLPDEIHQMFLGLSVVKLRHTYTERDFSAFLPPEIKQVGQMWSIDTEKIVPFLKQFHLNPKMSSTANGRMAGPDGAFAVLRSISPSHLDLFFRVHADIQLARNVWYTPACFLGRMLINRHTGTVEYFQMGIPTDRTLNVHLTAMAVSDGSAPDANREIKAGDDVMTRRDIVHVEQMELMSGNGKYLDELQWVDQIEIPQAKHVLRKIFYKFMEIEWVPFQEAIAEARRIKKPIFAVVMWGSLDDQSC